MKTTPRLIVGTVVAALALLAASCSRHDADSADSSRAGTTAGTGPAAASATVGASGVEAPYAAIVPADAQPPAIAGSAGKGTATAGAETSPSTSAGPGNGSTAVGGQAGGQATGVSRGGTPAKTSGDGR